MKGYSRGFRPLLWSVCAAVASSGLLLPTTLVLRFEWALPWRLPGAARIGVAALHATASFALLALIGALWSIHMRAGWRRRRQRISGSLLVSAFVLLAVSAVGLYYLGDGGAADTTALLHVALGLAVCLPLALHTVRGRRYGAATAQPLRRRGTPRLSERPR